VLEAPQAQHPGKLRHVEFRDFEFDVPEFPSLHADRGTAPPTQPPPDLGEHTAEVLKSAGVDAAAYQGMLAAGAIAEATTNAFAWAAVRREGHEALETARP
jgi:crotonobetainyl-CoA:carnitine CoA-transferase CaiB-like acyl-CoA transferase